MAFDLDGIRERCVITERGCWEWSLARTPAGYGVTRQGKKTQYVHRLSAALAYGEPSEGQFALHSCDNPPCANPDHLRWGSALENSRDAVARKRLLGRAHAAGESHPMSKLAQSQVHEIRALRSGGSKLRELADSFGVSMSTIHLIATGKHWKDS